MRDYALTFPQLVRQAGAAGFAESDLVRFRTGYDLAVGLVDGLYRKQDVPFLCHLVRTAGILVHETRDPDAVLCGLLHAAYFLHVFPGSRRRGPRPSDRRWLADRVGAGVASLIHDYSQFPWDADVARAYQDPARRADPRVATILLIRVADELEDHLDAAEALVPRGNFRDTDAYGREFVDLARALGRAELAADFEAAITGCRALRPPAGVLSKHGSSYEFHRRLWLASPIERLGSIVRRRRMGRSS